MTDYFAEKSQQVEPSELVAFGITISSRYGDASELIEMMRFAEMVAQKKVSHYVRRVFYDTKANYCNIELDATVQRDDPVASAILDAATETISQFDWFGTVQHGGSLLKSYAA